jgi:multiple sugar transport system permease protein
MLKQFSIRKISAHLFLLFGAVFMVTPFIWSITTSLKPLESVFNTPPFQISFPLNFNAYITILGKINFGLFTMNTFKIAAIITVGQLITCSMAGYAFARIKFPGRDFLFVLFLITMMVPATVTMIPNFILMSKFGWVNTHTGLIIPALASAFGTFLMRQFFLSFPSDLEDAAKLDGCNPFAFYWRILLPNSKPIMATLGVMTFQWVWNDFQWPLIMINTESKRTLQVGLSYLLNENYIDWPVLMAGSVITILPVIILFFFAQKNFVESIKLSGLKG